ncbi:MAG: hypothetical protein AMXMBFR64_44050 [Myxococcales bacterium]
MRGPAVLLLSPGILKWTDVDFGLPHLVSLGTWVKERTGARVEILDLGYEASDHAGLQRTLQELGPFLLIGVSCYSSYDYRRVMTLGRFLKGLYPDVPLVTGGYHASARPGDLAFEGSPFDAVVVGEGEVPLGEMVEGLLGGRRLGEILPGPIVGPRNLPSIDALPPQRWDLLGRYWPRAHEIGRKLQIVLSRGCPYHCTFCMERAKTDYTWRAWSEERALDELKRLARFTELGRWVVNIADPLFGFKRRWRRDVLEGIVRHGLVPRQFWTLTRSDDLDDEDIALLARARFSIGIGLESGSPAMLALMNKTRDPERYLGAIRRLAARSRDHGLTWATNVIVGHPGETPETLRETHAFLTDLFTSARETCGWLSIDPFRLYPGSMVYETMDALEAAHGARFHHREWWRAWYDGPLRAEHLDPSGALSFADRVRFMHDAYGPLVREIAGRFRGQGRSVDRVFERSMAEQVRTLSPENRDMILKKAAPARDSVALDIATPIGLHVRDERVRRREEAVRRLLERGALRNEALVEVLLTVAPEPFLGVPEAAAMLRDQGDEPAREGEAPRWIGFTPTALALGALEAGTGDRVADLCAASGWVAALLAALVGPGGEVLAGTTAGFLGRRRLAALLPSHVRVVPADPSVGPEAQDLDGLYLGAALPRFPAALRGRLREGGRAVTWLGPRFRPQDLVELVRRGDELTERVVARSQVPVVAGREGWLREPGP